MSDPTLPIGSEGGSPAPTYELKWRIVSAIVMAIVAILAAWAGGRVFLAIWMLAAWAVWWEWVGVVRAEPRVPVLAIGAASIIGIAFALMMDAAAFAFIGALVGAGVAAATASRARRWPAGGVLYAASVIVPVVMLRGDMALGLVAVIWLFAVVWAEDTGAYFTGRFFGGPKLAPSISPSKTWSGALGGTLAGIVAGNIVVTSSGIVWHPMHVLIALIVVVAAQAGDLLESAVKRRFAVKDASGLIPGHGGLMDRLDGFLVAASVALALGLLFGGAQAPAAGLLQW